MKILLLSHLSAGLQLQNFIFLFLFLLFSVPVVYSQVKFDGQTDIGKIQHKGSMEYNSSDNTYRITGSGDNIWYNEDAFFFVWRKTSGDLFLSADLEWVGEGKHEHRKGGWMVRTSLEKDAPYVDFMSHAGDGLVSLQYRLIKGGETFQVEAPIKAPANMLLERTGNQFTFSVTKDGKFIPVGTISLEMKDEVYVGLAVCSHDSTTSETAVFSNVDFKEGPNMPEDKRVLESTLEVIDIETGMRSIVRRAKEHFEAPNWSRDGKEFVYNSDGKIYKLPVNGGEPVQMNTGFANRCNNDHGISPDGKQFVISDFGKDGKSVMYTLPYEGGEPKQITKSGMRSYWHGWSPDGKTLAYCAEREEGFDIYTIPVEGGEETRLTTAPGYDDGPDYSPDGQYIYFNSDRTGQMKIWRMKTDGSEQIQFTPDDNYGDWFAHPSPDGKWIVILSYDKSVKGHPENKDVVLRIMPPSGGEPKILATLFGGQGTINVPSWSPDSKKVAFVSYRLVAP